MNIKLWVILGILGLVMLTSDEKKKRRGASKTPIDLQGLNLAGKIRSCDAWFKIIDKTGKEIHRCFVYAPSCNTTKCKTDPKLVFSGITATCKKYKKRPDGSKYCAEYAPTCGAEADGCRTEPAEIPGKPKKKTQKQIKAEMAKQEKAQERIAKGIAKSLAIEANERLDQNKELMRKILDYGGIAPYSSGYLSEEYKDIPTKYKRRDGIPIDELAQELGTNEADLVNEINMAERAFLELKQRRGGKTARRFKADDFINEAWDRMATGRGLMGYRKKIHGEDFFSPKQQELFPELRRNIALELDDPATSDDPLIACLERQGWDAKKVTKLQDSVAEKMTIDMFGKVKKLTGTEIMLQESIDKCLERLRK